MRDLLMKSSIAEENFDRIAQEIADSIMGYSAQRQVQVITKVASLLAETRGEQVLKARDIMEGEQNELNTLRTGLKEFFNEPK